ncbi:hypothetical protein Y032_0910g3001 [Ancylostoma ceylanicum]|uniref:Uncharacterized protein n=1 Tax=Ancylostoma ceylanicum TaxID=53326 RepID=A0A016W9L2_9BILA|nr:hypothetical protein Y032_0910g3001 [Ancylostoma ceylanicum]
MSKLVGHRCRRGRQPAHSRTAPLRWSMNCTLDPPKNGFVVTLCDISYTFLESAWEGDQGYVDISNTRNEVTHCL